MKFKAFKEYRLPGMDNITKYLSRDLVSNLRELSLGLERLSFEDNFISFKVENLEIGPGAEVQIDNNLTVIPEKRMILRQSGGGAITDGSTPWSLTSVYLKNEGATTANITVLFMR